MDSIIVAAARALAGGDALGALKLVALRDDAPGLALRGIAMAQLGDYALARDLLRRAVRGFGAREQLSRARCVVAEAEVALAMRDLRGSPRALAQADRANALQARLIGVRRLLLLGRLDEAEAVLARVDVNGIALWPGRESWGYHSERTTHRPGAPRWHNDCSGPLALSECSLARLSCRVPPQARSRRPLRRS